MAKTTNPFSLALAAALMEPPHDDAPYYEALGRFVTAYAIAEAGVHQLARHMTGVKDTKARIILGGMRLSDVSSILRKLLLEKNAMAKYKETDTCLVQLEIISKQRDKLVHRYVDYKDKALHVTNFLTVKSTLLTEEEKYTIYDLKTMRTDCWVIYARLWVVRDPSYGKKMDSDFRKRLKQPWRYKPPKPKTQRKQRRKDSG